MIPKNRAPTHPGEVLFEEFLKPLEISQLSFSKHLGWTQAKLNEIVREKRGVSPEAALALADALGTSPDLWLNLQRDYDLWHASKKHRKIKPLKKVA